MSECPKRSSHHQAIEAVELAQRSECNRGGIALQVSVPVRASTGEALHCVILNPGSFERLRNDCHTRELSEAWIVKCVRQARPGVTPLNSLRTSSSNWNRQSWCSCSHQHRGILQSLDRVLAIHLHFFQCSILVRVQRDGVSRAGSAGVACVECSRAHRERDTKRVQIRSSEGIDSVRVEVVTPRLLLLVVTLPMGSKPLMADMPVTDATPPAKL